MSGQSRAKLDTKLLILYVLKRLPNKVDSQLLYDLCCSKNLIGYFDFSECLNELIDSENVFDENNLLSITEKGTKNILTVENSIPYSFRVHADEATQPLIEKFERDSLIKSETEISSNEVFSKLALSDGIGKLIEIKLLCSDEKQSKEINENFRQNAEKIYKKIIEMLAL